MVFPLGIPVIEGISAPPFWSRRTSGLFVFDRDFVRDLGDHPLVGSTCRPGPALSCFQRFRLGRDSVSDLSHAGGLGHRSRRGWRGPRFDAEGSAGLRVVDLGRWSDCHGVSILALRASLVCLNPGSAVACCAARIVRDFLLISRRDRCSGGDFRDGHITPGASENSWWRCPLKTVAIAFVVVAISTAVLSAEQSAVNPSPKLAAMLGAKDESGKPIVTAEQQTYFDGLNDNLKEMLNHAVEKETISRPEHLSTLLGLQLRSQKMELVLQNNCILCHSDSANHSADTLFAVAV